MEQRPKRARVALAERSPGSRSCARRQGTMHDVTLLRKSSRCPVLTVEGGKVQRRNSAGSNTSPRVSARAASRRYWAGSIPTSFAVSSSV